MLSMDDEGSMEKVRLMVIDLHGACFWQVFSTGRSGRARFIDCAPRPVDLLISRPLISKPAISCTLSPES